MEKKQSNKRIPLITKIAYGFPGGSYFIAFNVLALYLIWFFTESVGFLPGFAGLIASIGILWDAITDPLVGIWSDNRDPKKGRRRPFMLAVAIPLGLCIWLMFTDFGFSSGISKIYFVVIGMAYYTCMTLLDVPYTALGAEMTSDYDERSSLANYRNILSQVANFGTALIFFILPYFAGKFDSMTAGWSATMGVFGALATAGVLIGWKFTKGYELTERTNSSSTSYKDYVEVLKNKPFRNIVYMYASSILAMGFVNTLLLFFLIIVGGLGEAQVPFALMIVFGFSILFAPVINYISQKTSKKIAWLFGMGSWAITLLIFPLVIIPGLGNPVIGSYAMLFFSAIGVTAQYQVAWSMIPDCVELDELITGKRREGIFYATATFIQKVATALAMLLAGFMLQKIGYAADVEITTKISDGIRYLFAFGASIPLIFSAVIVLFTPMNRKRHEKLVAALEARKLGKAYTLDGLEELFSGDIKKSDFDQLNNKAN